mmetsp:Transcript_12246/g.52628  ORF Transcript_12246/g.52628 Transcript_12246/m.52628 type:complete len:217 (+) Transcript_12246:891-1541(+)
MNKTSTISHASTAVCKHACAVSSKNRRRRVNLDDVSATFSRLPSAAAARATARTAVTRCADPSFHRRSFTNRLRTPSVRRDDFLFPTLPLSDSEEDETVSEEESLSSVASAAAHSAAVSEAEASPAAPVARKRFPFAKCSTASRTSRDARAVAASSPRSEAAHAALRYRRTRASSSLTPIAVTRQKAAVSAANRDSETPGVDARGASHAALSATAL